MKKSKKKKNKKRIANNYLGMAAIAIVVLLLLGGLTYQSQTLKARIAVYDAKASALEDSIAGEQEILQKSFLEQSPLFDRYFKRTLL